MLEEKDFMLRLIRDVLEAVTGKKKEEDDAQESAAAGDPGPERFADLFSEITGISPAFLTPQTIGMVPDMLRLSTDPSRVVLAARLLVGRGQAGPDGAPFLAAASRLLAAWPHPVLLPEIEQLRLDSLKLLQQSLGASP